MRPYLVPDVQRKRGIYPFIFVQEITEYYFAPFVMFQNIGYKNIIYKLRLFYRIYERGRRRRNIFLLLAAST
jgi:hypothetical protein